MSAWLLHHARRAVSFVAPIRFEVRTPTIWRWSPGGPAPMTTIRQITMRHGRVVSSVALYSIPNQKEAR